MRKLRVRWAARRWQNQLDTTCRCKPRSPLPEQGGETTSFDIVLPVADPPPRFFQQTLASVAAQSCSAWSLLVCLDGSQSAPVMELLEQFQHQHSKQTVIVSNDTRQGIVSASNRAADNGISPWVCFLDHDDRLHPLAIQYLSQHLRDYDNHDIVYTDESKIDESGRQYDFFLKPDWSPSLLLGCNYWGHLVAIRRALFTEAGKFRSGYDGSQDHDLWLRASERTSRIGHIPQVLYHWRAWKQSTAQSLKAKSQAPEHGRRAVAQALARRQITSAEVHSYGWEDRYRLSLHKTESTIGVIAIPPITFQPTNFVVDPLPGKPDVRAYLQSLSSEFVVVMRHVEAAQHDLQSLIVPLVIDRNILMVGGVVCDRSQRVLNAGRDWLRDVGWWNRWHRRWCGDHGYMGLGLVTSEIHLPDTHFFAFSKTRVLSVLEHIPKELLGDNFSSWMMVVAIAGHLHGFRNVVCPFVSACVTGGYEEEIVNIDEQAQAWAEMLPSYSHPFFSTTT